MAGAIEDKKLYVLDSIFCKKRLTSKRQELNIIVGFLSQISIKIFVF